MTIARSQTAVALPLLLATNFVQASPTIEPTKQNQLVLNVQAALSLSTFVNAAAFSSTSDVQRSNVLTDDSTFLALPGRETSEYERVVGELRSWRMLGANWDGEGAAAPNDRSIREAVGFVGLLATGVRLPEPMLHASGNAGLFWKNESDYADLEFLGDGQLAYYVERDQGKHKGVVKFDQRKVPPVLEALLSA